MTIAEALKRRMRCEPNNVQTCYSRKISDVSISLIAMGIREQESSGVFEYRNLVIYMLTNYIAILMGFNNS